MYMKRIIIVLLFFSSGFNAYSQIIHGTIMDKQTKEKLVFASVYFSSSFVGTHSDNNGNFILNISGHASMPVTVSALGYYSETISGFPIDKPIIIYLRPKVFELTEVTINAKAREKILRMFKDNFLGTSDNASRCEITNEQDIKLTLVNDTLRAYASNPIQIINRGLGYKESYYLDKFWFYTRKNAFLISGNLVFDEDLISDKSRKEYYLLSREQAYRGSRMHFFRSLWKNDLDYEGFSLKNAGEDDVLYSNIIFRHDSLTKFIKFRGMLGVHDNIRLTTSWITFLRDYVSFDQRGYFDAFAVSWDGLMAKQRVGDMLPYEYHMK